MSVTSVHKDPEAMTMTITADFDAPIGAVWHLWDNPRQLRTAHPSGVASTDRRLPCFAVDSEHSRRNSHLTEFVRHPACRRLSALGQVYGSNGTLVRSRANSALNLQTVEHGRAGCLQGHPGAPLCESA